MKCVLDRICAELKNPFSLSPSDFPIYQDLKEEDVFYLCSGETRYTLKKGSLVSATVIRYDEDKNILRTRLECGLDANIGHKDIKDSADASAEEMRNYRPGAVVNARITRINTEGGFWIWLSIKSKDLA
mmetsp:Transcript_6830/g.3799  ORF Transcript_6830/g.3799 Transcript_6830/m.3799 type:complete len:129 (-) Transcript_6830:804-1190(-)|eukprot:CAMPEP_0201285206 /NCGR_PEP_ID=MMETSP1317-20130820/98641_1 /ASSEMBLY_ACC=CAM_ASM_000770 /TAXON_ID=187299 /ORGANISM="Undescribed Undescribed, Strain Undescribed" /LENGTH=128 /DNA_ID=CAMNT_0047608883 /DNA_START=359 /DNA_END=745 /DNA_ORIENTATION=+